MGWSKGKGLGAHEDGEQNFIRVSHKTDQKGMGYEDRDDQWTGHENQFTSLLESLNNSRSPSDDEKSGEDQSNDAQRTGFGFSVDEKKKKKLKSKLSGKSLEEMSKTSSVRVHYRKFTRGKDISRYSEKELANIFGKKCINGDIIEKTDQDASASRENDDAAECNYGITTIETGTSVQDYFKMKKRKKEVGGDDAAAAAVDVALTMDSTANVDGCEKKRRKKDKLVKSEQIVVDSIEGELTHEIKHLEKKKKKDKKKSKKESAVESPQKMHTIVVSDEDSAVEIVSIKTKKKKRKNKKDSDENHGESIETAEPTGTDAIDGVADGEDGAEPMLKKKKRDKKKRAHQLIPSVPCTEEVNTTEPKSINNTQFIDGILGLLVQHSPHSSTALPKQASDECDDDDDDDTEAPPTNTQIAKPTSNIAMDQVFEINRYHAEMFRFVDLDGFPDANLSELSGYGYSNDFELKISEKSKDQSKINDLWDCALVNKYGMEVIQAKKAKKSKQYSISKLKKKNLFRQL